MIIKPRTLGLIIIYMRTGSHQVPLTLFLYYPNSYIYIYIYIYVLYRGKEQIHSEIELIIFYVTEVVPSDKYYKSHAVGVSSKVGLTTDRDLLIKTCLRNITSFIPLRYRKSHSMSHYTTINKYILQQFMVANISLSGSVVNQMQYNLECAQYLW